MALSPIEGTDQGVVARTKVNNAFKLVDAIKLQSDSVEAETDSIAAALAALQIQLAPYQDLVGGNPDRPGDSRTLFTASLAGAPKGRPAIEKGTVEDGGELGQVLRISGSDADPVLGYVHVAPRRAYYVRQGRTYLVRHSFARFQDPSDPLQHAVELRIQNLNGAFGSINSIRLGDAYAPAKADGPYFVDTFIGKPGAPGSPQIVINSGASYVVPYFRVYGNGHQTDLGEIGLYDVSDALSGGADITSILARLTQLEAGRAAGVIYATSWNDLKDRVGKADGVGAETPEGDIGTHTDPVSGATVPNAGRFSYSVSPAGWRYVGPTGLSAIAPLTASIARLSRATATYRPSDVLDAWTASPLNGDTAPSIALGAAYSLVDAPDGKALRIAAGTTVGVGPKHADPFYVGQTYEYAVAWSRPTDGTDPEVRLYLRGYNPDGSAIASVRLLLTRSLLAADGFKVDTARITGAAIKAAMPTAVVVRPYIFRPVSGGPLDVSAITTRTLDPALLSIQSTRYFAYPGEAIETWTSDITASPAAASPLVPTGAFSLVTGVAGKALRLTGVANAGPMALVRLEDGETYDFVVRVSRAVDDPVPANNTPLFRFRTFDNAGVDAGVVFLPSAPVLAADGVRTFTFRASRTAGLGTANLPAGTRYLRPYVTGAGTTGAIDIYAIDRVSSGGSGAPATIDELADDDGLLVWDASAQKNAQVLLPKLIAQLEAKMAAPPVFWFKGPKTASKTEDTLIAAPDAGVMIQNVRFQNKSRTAYVALGFAGSPATLEEGGSYLFGPGQGRDFDIIPPGRVGIISDTDLSPITCEFASTTSSDPNSKSKVAAHLARFTGVMTDPQRKAVGDFYQVLLESGWVEMCAGNGSIWVGRASGNPDGLLDWARPTRTFTPITINSATAPSTSFAGTVFNGSNAIDTLVTPLASAVNKHSMFVGADQADAGSTKAATGNTTIRVAPNRTATVTTLYAGGGSLLVTAGARGGLQGYTRSNNALIRFYRNGNLKIDVDDVSDDPNLGSQTIYIGGLHALSGLTLGYTGTLEFQAQTYGAVPSDEMVNRLDAGLAVFRAALGV